MKGPRRLKGHKAALTCCIASRTRPGFIATSAEDGCICLFDLRCKDVLFTIDVGKEPISSICFKGGNDDVVYASSGTQIASFDIHMPSAPKPFEIHNYNKEEINQIVFSPNSYFLASADDSGEVKIIDTRQKCLYKTLRSVHTSICSSVQFIPWKPWTAITGGLDSKLAMWDFSKGRAYDVVDYGMPDGNGKGSSSSIEQCFNPSFVHCVAVPDMDMMAGLKKVCAVARGDFVVDLIEIESPAAKKSTSLGKRVQLDYTVGGHIAAVSCVCFSLFDERGKFLISGGNDASVKLWDWSKHFVKEETSSSNNEILLNLDVKKKVNWLCTTPSDSENLIVCDTSKILKAYSVT